VDAGSDADADVLAVLKEWSWRESCVVAVDMWEVRARGGSFLRGAWGDVSACSMSIRTSSSMRMDSRRGACVRWGARRVWTGHWRSRIGRGCEGVDGRCASCWVPIEASVSASCHGGRIIHAPQAAKKRDFLCIFFFIFEVVHYLCKMAIELWKFSQAPNGLEHIIEIYRHVRVAFVYTAPKLWLACRPLGLARRPLGPVALSGPPSI